MDKRKFTNSFRETPHETLYETYFCNVTSTLQTSQPL